MFSYVEVRLLLFQGQKGIQDVINHIYGWLERSNGLRIP